MSETTYAPSMGRLKALSGLLLPKETILSFAAENPVGVLRSETMNVSVSERMRP